MANKLVFSLNYTSEVSGRSGVQNFTIGKAASETTAFRNLGYGPAVPVVCPTPREFSRRYLNVKFDTGIEARFPVPRRSDIINYINTVLSDETVVCVDLVGEKWTTIPGYGNPAVAYDSGDFPNFIRGVIQYSSDLFEQPIGVNLKLSEPPTQISERAIFCTGFPNPQAICDQVPSRFKSRRMLTKTRNTNASTKDQSIVSRDIPISNREDIVNCILSIAPVVNCIGYQGESALAVNNLILREAVAGGGQINP